MGQTGREFFEERFESIGGKVIDLKLDTCVRVNSLRPSDVVNRLKSLGVVLEQVPFLENSYFVKNSEFSVGAITEYLLGYYYIQSAAAQLPAVVLDPQPGEKVLDMCSAPGGKCTQMAALMQNKGELISFELKRPRIISLLTNLERCGVKNCVAFLGDASRVRKFGIQFDRVLLDAPCTGNFVSDRRWFSQRNMEGVKRSATIQRRLLRIASEVVKPGGSIVYSTCSLDPIENELNVQWAIDNLPLSTEDTGLNVGEPALTEFWEHKLAKDVSKARRFWPHRTNTEGFFIVKFVKR